MMTGRDALCCPPLAFKHDAVAVDELLKKVQIFELKHHLLPQDKGEVITAMQMAHP
jgi:hypothetical protein